MHLLTCLLISWVSTKVPPCGQAVTTMLFHSCRCVRARFGWGVQTTANNGTTSAWVGRRHSGAPIRTAPCRHRPPGTGRPGRPRQVWFLAAARNPDGYKMIREATGRGNGKRWLSQLRMTQSVFRWWVGLKSTELFAASTVATSAAAAAMCSQAQLLDRNCSPRAEPCCGYPRNHR